MMTWRRWLGLSPSTEAGSASPEAASDPLDSLKPKHVRYLAAYAAVLARVAYTDREISAEEAQVMTDIIRQIGSVSEQDAELIVAIASSDARRQGDEEGRAAAQTLGTVCTRAQRLDLLRCLFAVAAATDNLSADEYSKIEEIGRELALSPADLESCRLQLGGRPLPT